MFPQKLRRPVIIWFLIILAYGLSGGSGEVTAAPMSAPQLQEVTLGDEYRSLDGSFSFLTAPGYTVEDEFGFITMNAPDGDPDTGPLIMFGSYLTEEDVTSEQVLTEWRQDFGDEGEISDEWEVTVDGIPGLAVDISGMDGDQAMAGRLVVLVVPPAQGFVMMGGAPAERWDEELAPIFEAVLASVKFSPEPEVAEPFAEWISFTNANDIWDMALDDEGNLWVAGPGGVVRWQSDGAYTKYTTEAGLAKNVVNAVAVSPDGAVWFGTLYGGVSRFDGQDWTTYTDRDGLGDNTVSAISVAPDGSLWFGHRGGGVSRFDGQDWTTYTEEDGLAYNYLNDIAIDTLDTLWFATDEGLSYFDGQSWTTHTEEDGLPESYIETVAAAPDGTVWVGTSSGVSRFDGQDWTTFTTDDGLVDNWVNDIAIGPDGIVWVGTISGVSGFDGLDWTTFTTDDGLADNWVNDIEVALDGLWLGHEGAGFSYFDGITWTTYATDDALPENDVNAVAVAPDGAAWLAMEGGGLARFDGRTWTTYTWDDGLPSDFILSVGAADDGTIWAGTDLGLARFDGQEWTTFTTDDGLIDNYVSSLAVAPDGTVWAGTWFASGGVSSFDGQEWTTYTQADGLASESIEDVAVTPDGVVWFATSGGVSSFDGQEWTTYTTEDGLGDNSVTAIAVAPDGLLWFATGDGVSSFDGLEWVDHGPEYASFTSIAVAPDGTVLAGSEWADSDTYCFDGLDWMSCSAGLVDNTIKDITVSPDGSIWVATSSGVSGYMPAGVSAGGPAFSGEILFQEDFETNRRGWYIGEGNDEYGESNAELLDGRYRLSRQASRDVTWRITVDDVEFDDFVLSVDAMPGVHNAPFAYGLVFRHTEDGDFYLFQIDSDGFFTLRLYEDEEWSTLVDFTEMAAINSDEPNGLVIKAVGPRMSFFINDEEAITIEDDTLEQGSIGVALALYEADDSATAEFDNLIVRQVADETGPVVSDNNVIFAEYFDSDANGWATGEFEDQFTLDQITIEDGLYRLDVIAKQSAYVEKQLPNQEFSDFVLTVEATPQDSAEHYSYGIAFREDKDLNSYTFEIGNDGLYGIRLYDGEWHTLKDWSSTDAINVGETNELMVIADGSTLTFLVNGEQLTQIEDDSLAAGTVGLIVDVLEEDTEATVDFDNLVIKSLDGKE